MSTATQPTHDPSYRPRVMLHALARNWWMLLLRGIAAIIFGVLAFVTPGLTLVTLVLFFGAFALVDGVLALAAAVAGGGSPLPRWWLAVVGVASIVTGVLTFIWPGITALVLLIFIAGWAIVLGIFEIYGAIKLREEINNEWLLILGGALSVLFGILLFVQPPMPTVLVGGGTSAGLFGIVLFYRPGTGALAMISLIGAYAIVRGVIYVAFAFRLLMHLGAHARP